LSAEQQDAMLAATWRLDQATDLGAYLAHLVI